MVYFFCYKKLVSNAKAVLKFFSAVLWSRIWLDQLLFKPRPTLPLALAARVLSSEDWHERMALSG